MKRIVFKSGVLTSLLVLFCLVFASCSSDNDEDDASSTDAAINENGIYINFTLDENEENFELNPNNGSAFSGDDFMRMSLNASNGIAFGDPEYMRIALFFPNRTVSSGTYDFSPDITDNDAYKCTISVGASTWRLDSGSITIVSNANGHIAGRFSGSAQGSGENSAVSITEGTFRGVSVP